MNLGIFGGTFDPVHYGHLQLAETCRQELSLDQLRIIPARNPPHKPGQQITDGNARAEMVALAVSGYPEFVVDRRELRRQGPSFTVDTLQELADENSGADLFFLMGTDSLEEFPEWREPERIAELATVVAVNRPGHPLPGTGELVNRLGASLAARIRLLTHPGTDISASDLRDRIRQGISVRFFTPRAVEIFLTEHNLYAQKS